MVQHIITEIDTSTTNVTASNLAKTVTLLDAMHMLKVAWKDVKLATITNCFRKAGFSLHLAEENPTLDNQHPEEMTQTQFDEFVDIDSNLQCHGVLTDEDIINSVRQTSEDPDSDDDDSTPEPLTTSREAYIALKKVRSYFEQNNLDLTEYYAIEKILQAAMARKTKQINITDFLKCL